MIGNLIREKTKSKTKTFNPNKTMIVDISNFFWIMRYSKLKNDNSSYDPDGADLVFQEVFKSIFNINDYNLKCDHIVFAFDAPNTWRKQLYPDYKKGRKAEVDIYRKELFEKMNQFYELFDSYTNITCLKIDEAEADDIISVYSQNRKENEEVFIVSTDKDFVQLISDHVHLFDPVKKDYRKSENGVEEDLFIKCFRGDTGDNIPNIYPRIRKTKLLDAYNNSYTKMNIMETFNNTFEQKVGDLYEKNRTLIDLRQQPSSIRENIYNEIHVKTTENKYDQSLIISHLKSLEMNHLIDVVNKYNSHLK